VYTWANGCKYEGNFAGGYPYGSGTFTYLDGTTKTSTDWAHAEKEEYTYSGGEYEGQLACYYTGMMINNEAYGYGSFKWTENDPFCPGWIYSGEMNEDDANGYGVINFNIANTKYEGYVAAGYPSGFGVYTDSTGGIQEADNWLWIGGTAEFSEDYGEDVDFEGMSIDGVWTGMGHLTAGDGNFWGEFRENTIDGAGKFIYSNGEELFGEKWIVELSDGVGYSGMMLDGVKAGYGVRITKEGYKYAGENLNDMKHGYGVFDTPAGDHYEGFWANDVRHGKGVYTWAENGNVYDGDFLEGKRTGKATMLFAKSGDVYEGDFVDGKRHGTGTYTWNSGDKKGDKYVGDWVEGERTGFGIYYYADGTSKSGQWEKGKFIG
ncbi:MAG: hypothetical protein IKU17_06040, partial [Clostridia bacterium]|nr:hypothetical protein [Clostridia bacterium]